MRTYTYTAYKTTARKLTVKWTVLLFMFIVAAAAYGVQNHIYGRFGWAVLTFDVMIFLIELARNIVEWMRITKD